MNAPVALITGSPGVGKTAVTEMIARRTGCAHVEEDVVYAMLPSLAREVHSCEVVNLTILALTHHFVGMGRSVLIEGMFPFPGPTDSLVNALSIRAGCRLVASVETCLARNQQRAPGGIELEPTEVMALHQAATPSRFVTIDAERSLEDVVNAVLKALGAHGWTT